MIFQDLLRVYPIKIMGDINYAGYFLSVLHILSGGPIHNYYLSLNIYKCSLQSIYLSVNNPQIRPNKKYYVFPVTDNPQKIGSVGRERIFFINFFFVRNYK